MASRRNAMKLEKSEPRGTKAVPSWLISHDHLAPFAQALQHLKKHGPLACLGADGKYKFGLYRTPKGDLLLRIWNGENRVFIGDYNLSKSK